MCTIRLMTQTLKRIRSSYTFRLRKGVPTFVEGVASILDLDSKIITNYNIDDTDNQADYNSLKADWDAVGKDLRSAFDQYAR